MDKQKAIHGAERLGMIIVTVLIIAGTGICALLGRDIEIQHEQTQITTMQHQISVKEREAAQVKAQVNTLKKQVETQQTVIKSLSSRSDSRVISVSNWMPFEASWYDGQQGINGLGNDVTATGTYVRNQWTVAVDPSVIPLGSIVQIKFPDGTSQLYQALDVGGAIKGHRVDIFDSNPADCMRRGMQHVQVRVITKG